MRKEIRSLIRQLKSRRINCFDIPFQFQSDMDIVRAERQLGFRTIGNRGYDIISNRFFVEEYLSAPGREKRLISQYFDDYTSFADYIDNEIYDHACYYQLNFSQLPTSIDLRKMQKKKCFTKDRVDAYTINPTKQELLEYNKFEKRKEYLKNWVGMFNRCCSLTELENMASQYKNDKNTVQFQLDISFFLLQYAFIDRNSKTRFHIIMDFISKNADIVQKLIYPLCSIYDPNEIWKYYCYHLELYNIITAYNIDLEDYISKLKNGGIVFSREAYFDVKTHFFCETIQGWKQNDPTNIIVCYEICFDSFDEFLKYRNNDLTHCDLLAALLLDFDFSSCTIDETTKLPLISDGPYTYKIKKWYRNNAFHVSQEWYYPDGKLAKKHYHSFDFFFDFVGFLKGDLSDANLIYCDGLYNLTDITNINFSNAKIRSAICDKLGIAYEECAFSPKLLLTSPLSEKNEKETTLILQPAAEISLLNENVNQRIIYYISDLHLPHKLKQFNAKSKADIEYVVSKAANAISSEAKFPYMENNGIILIGGDVADDFSLFKLFVQLLRGAINRNYRCPSPKIIFVLGNHEYQALPTCPSEKIVHSYETLLKKYDMYLLQDNVLHLNDDGNLLQISTEEITVLDEQALRNQVRHSRIILFGGLCFSEEFLYNKVCSAFYDKPLIILTHMPTKEDWTTSAVYHKNFFYVSGHTHQNSFYDDGEFHIYADNQIGYHNVNMHLKYFLLDARYDYFSDYKDGIHEITADEYKEFMRGKNIMMSFNRITSALYMLKRHGYYCFIYKSKNGTLHILNGGSSKTLKHQDINYYYENMNSVITYLNRPLNHFTKYQESISSEIQKIGGSGRIHGCIIDIDFYNHIFVDPINGTLTGYYAESMMNLLPFPSIPALLKFGLPHLYARYKEICKKDANSFPLIVQDKNLSLATRSQQGLNTDIYKASREIKKMQKLHSNILAEWLEPNENEAISTCLPKLLS